LQWNEDTVQIEPVEGSVRDVIHVTRIMLTSAIHTFCFILAFYQVVVVPPVFCPDG